MNELLKELEWRNLLKDVANKDSLEKIIKNKGKFYIGIDPTADSIHVGHYLSISLSNILNKHGLKPVIVIGGFTGMIGDPSGRNSEREVIDKNIVRKNVVSITKQVKKLTNNLNMTDVEIIDNTQIYEKMSIIELFQTYGKLFNINTMLSKESVKNRIEKGISYTEFSYQVFQAIDFFYLFKNKNVRIQLGGSDQWGNITSGIDLIRKIEGPDQDVSGITINLLTDENGNKIGKTQGNPMWLDKSKTSPYTLYQYFFNLSDEIAKKLLAQSTNITKKEYGVILNKHNSNPKKRYIQNELAKRFITNVHSLKDYEESYELSSILFEERYNEISSKHENSLKELPHIKNNTDLTLIDLLIKNKNIPSKRVFREFISNGSIKINGISISDENFKLNDEFINDKFAFVNIGKKNKLLILK